MSLWGIFRARWRALVWLLGMFAAGFGTAWLLGPGAAHVQANAGIWRPASERERANAQKNAHSQRDFERFVELVKEDPTSIALADYYLTIDALDAAQRRDFIAVLEAMPPGRQRDEKRGIFLWMWSQKAPKEMMGYADGLAIGRQREELTRMALGGWAKQDAPAALQWLEAQRPHAYASSLMRYQHVLVENWSAQDPAGALAYLQKLPVESQRDRDLIASGYRNVVQAIVESGDVQGALGVIAALPAGDLRDRSSTALAQSWARAEPEAALAWAASLEGDQRDRAMNVSFAHWSRENPQVALQWALQRPESDTLRDGMALMAVGSWIAEDLDGAAQWINQQQASPQRDNMVAQFVGRAAADDAAGAMVWAQQIDNEKMRQRAQTQTMHTWIRTDPGQARAYLEGSHSFSQKQTAEFLKRLEQQN